MSFHPAGRGRRTATTPDVDRVSDQRGIARPDESMVPSANLPTAIREPSRPQPIACSEIIDFAGTVIILGDTRPLHLLPWGRVRRWGGSVERLVVFCFIMRTRVNGDRESATPGNNAP